MRKKRMLITGISGLLGNNLAFCLKDKYDILGLYNSHEVEINGIQTKKADITAEKDIRNAVEEFNPKIIIHCAALSNVEFCEENKDLADKVNIEGTKVVVDKIKELHAKLIYISSDMVYDDIGRRPIAEANCIKPPNHYGLTKYKGEQEALKKSESLVIRTNFFGWNIQDKFGLAEWVLNELSNNNNIQGFNDVYFSSIYTLEFAEILDNAINKSLSGIYNCASSNSMSKYEFAVKLADLFHLNSSLIESISVDNFNFKAKRKKNLELDVGKISRDLSYDIPNMEQSIEKFYEDFKSGIFPLKVTAKN